MQLTKLWAQALTYKLTWMATVLDDPPSNCFIRNETDDVSDQPPTCKVACDRLSRCHHVLLFMVEICDVELHDCVDQKDDVHDPVPGKWPINLQVIKHNLQTHTRCGRSGWSGGGFWQNANSVWRTVADIACQQMSHCLSVSLVLLC